MTLHLLHEFLIDPNSTKNILTHNSYVPGVIVAVYVFYTKFFGPAIMKYKNPYNLQKAMIIFNSLLVVGNAYAATTLLIWSLKYWHIRCDFKQQENYKIAIEESINYCWPLYLLKYAELMDTVFFVLRKKHKQISFLHVFHHSAVCLYFWRIMKNRQPSFYMYIVLTINSFVHVTMYFYYALAAVGPKAKKYLWWKKYITTIQIVQFLTIIAYMGHAHLTGCEILSTLDASIMAIVLALTILFLNFYIQTFRK
ncbi:elongation of very long chain fatty acids protein 7-like [Uloborus diversus]|uniref:elongation of very long chain fatty acids protein 7-like n=1 Tax=Uloborus diversus TaxID=327109 RepID=UPI00240A4677|nr:elongation of very long chain fatty acids protein 7-like [Uloborus diversus]